MDRFLYERDLRYERVKLSIQYSFAATKWQPSMTCLSNTILPSAVFYLKIRNVILNTSVFTGYSICVCDLPWYTEAYSELCQTS